MITFLASFLIWFLFLGLVVLWVIDGKIKKEQVLHALLAVFTVWLLTEAIKNFFPIPRPFLMNGGERLTIISRNDGAFPSFHTAVAFAISTTIWLHDRRVGIFFLLASILIGVGRVLGNVHYPVDILGGALLGILTAVFFEKVHPRA